MTGFILIGLALFGGDLLPWFLRLLLLFGGVLSLAAPFMGSAQSRGDPGASYPYPTQDDVLDGDDDYD